MEITTNIDESLKKPILVVDFGSQYSMLIARRIRELEVYCEVISPTRTIEEIHAMKPLGVILSGGPASVYDNNAPTTNVELLKSTLPVLGIGYGMQLMVHQLGGRVQMSTKREFGKTAIKSSYKSLLLQSFNRGKKSCDVWMSHGDKVITMPVGFRSIASSSNTKFTAVENRELNFYGLQFHPEVVHTPNGFRIVRNFVFKICKCKKNWSMKNHPKAQKNIIKKST